jgi:hypothetical protein
MRALTLHPEWLWVIRYLGKRVENRRWKLPDWIVNKPVLLHAGKKVGGGKTIQGLEWVKEMSIKAGIDCVRNGDCLHFTEKVFPCQIVPPSGLIVPPTVDIKTTLHLQELNLGQIVGVTSFVACDLKPGRWCADNQWHWYMGVTKFFSSPIPCRGYQKLWNVPDDIQQLVDKQLNLSSATFRRNEV